MDPMTSQAAQIVKGRLTAYLFVSTEPRHSMTAREVKFCKGAEKDAAGNHERPHFRQIADRLWKRSIASESCRTSDAISSRLVRCRMRSFSMIS